MGAVGDSIGRALELPPGVRLFVEGEASKLCWPEEAVQWTHEGAATWFYVSERPLPPCEPALSPRSSRRCPKCSQKDVQVVWFTCKGGKQRLRLQCRLCGAFAGWMRKDPRNPDLVWRTT
jgi:hypothetical protein